MRQKSSWAHGSLLGFDLETTGVDPESDRAVTMALIHRIPDHDLVRHSWLINPGVEIPPEMTAIHGITNEQVRQHGCPPAEAWGQAADVLARLWTPETPLVAYNLSFDVTMGDRELSRHLGTGIDFGERFAVDPLVIDRANDKWRKGGRKLTQVCEHYGISLGEDAHDAVADTEATMRLAYRLAATYPASVGYVDLADLHARQIEWNAVWCKRMGNWLAAEALKMERAWSSGNLVFVRTKLTTLKIEEEPSDELIERTCAETRRRSADLMSSATMWPMRTRLPAEPVIA